MITYNLPTERHNLKSCDPLSRGSCSPDSVYPSAEAGKEGQTEGFEIYAYPEHLRPTVTPPSPSIPFPAHPSFTSTSDASPPQASSSRHPTPKTNPNPSSLPANDPKPRLIRYISPTPLLAIQLHDHLRSLSSPSPSLSTSSSFSSSSSNPTMRGKIAYWYTDAARNRPKKQKSKRNQRNHRSPLGPAGGNERERSGGEIFIAALSPSGHSLSVPEQGGKGVGGEVKVEMRRRMRVERVLDPVAPTDLNLTSENNVIGSVVSLPGKGEEAANSVANHQTLHPYPHLPPRPAHLPPFPPPTHSVHHPPPPHLHLHPTPTPTPPVNHPHPGPPHLPLQPAHPIPPPPPPPPPPFPNPLPLEIWEAEIFGIDLALRLWSENLSLARGGGEGHWLGWSGWEVEWEVVVFTDSQAGVHWVGYLNHLLSGPNTSSTTKMEDTSSTADGEGNVDVNVDVEAELVQSGLPPEILASPSIPQIYKTLRTLFTRYPRLRVHLVWVPGHDVPLPLPTALPSPSPTDGAQKTLKPAAAEMRGILEMKIVDGMARKGWVDGMLAERKRGLAPVTDGGGEGGGKRMKL